MIEHNNTLSNANSKTGFTQSNQQRSVTDWTNFGQQAAIPNRNQGMCASLGETQKYQQSANLGETQQAADFPTVLKSYGGASMTVNL